MAEKTHMPWSLICVFCKESLLEAPCPATQRGVAIFFLGKPDVQRATKLEAEASSSWETSEGLREIIRRAKFAMRFSGRPEHRKRLLLLLLGTEVGSPA